jgi:GMP synthase-like glutamine amidotransferase
VRELLAAGTPTLGICFGSQLLADALGAVVGPAPQPEIGWHEIQLTAEGRSDPVLGGLPDRFDGFGYHHYEWSLPPGAVELARSERSLQGFRLERRPVWGLQFHPEVTHGDLCSWLDDWQGDSGAVATGLDPDVIRMQSAARIEGWNDIGRAIAQRFLAAAGEALAGQPAGRTR